MEAQAHTIENRRGKRMPASAYARPSARGTFVLAHGLGGSKDQRVMLAMIRAVYGSGYSVLAFDASDGPNAPDADPLGGTVTGYLEDLEDAVAWVRQGSGLTGPISLGGHSMGAFVAAEHAARHPGCAERLLLAAPAISWRTYLPTLPLALWWQVRGKVRLPDPDLRRYWIGRQWLADFRRYDGFRSASRVDVPALVVIAGRDRLVGTVRTHLRYARAFPQGTARVIPGASHTFHPYEDALAATIAQWLT